MIQQCSTTKENEAHKHQNTCTRMFIEALVNNEKIRNDLKCPPTEQKNKLC